MSTLTLVKVDFHDRSPPSLDDQPRKNVEFLELLDCVGSRVYELVTDHVTQVDLRTRLSVDELRCFLCDHFIFVGSIEINDELEIVREEGSSADTNQKLAAVRKGQQPEGR